jgi:hypothetical protein
VLPLTAVPVVSARQLFSWGLKVLLVSWNPVSVQRLEKQMTSRSLAPIGVAKPEPGNEHQKTEK